MKELMTSEGLSRARPSYLSPIVPNRWQGECDCVVGPFSSQTVAEYFANTVVDFGQYETMSRQVFAKGDSWYVEVHECLAPKVLSPSRS